MILAAPTPRGYPASMTTQQDTGTKAPAASANGAGPAVTAEECADCATTADRLMGILGLAFACALAAIGIDLITGGALSRLAAGLTGRGEGDEAAGA